MAAAFGERPAVDPYFGEALRVCFEAERVPGAHGLPRALRAQASWDFTPTGKGQVALSWLSSGRN